MPPTLMPRKNMTYFIVSMIANATSLSRDKITPMNPNQPSSQKQADEAIAIDKIKNQPKPLPDVHLGVDWNSTSYPVNVDYHTTKAEYATSKALYEEVKDSSISWTTKLLLAFLILVVIASYVHLRAVAPGHESLLWNLATATTGEQFFAAIMVYTSIIALVVTIWWNRK
jgi:hypothetical protein